MFDKKPSPFRKKNQKEIIGDILNKNHVLKAIKGCDYVFHFAAQANIESSTVDPLSTIKNNILGTQNVLEVSKDVGIKRFIFSVQYMCTVN